MNLLHQQQLNQYHDHRTVNIDARAGVVNTAVGIAAAAISEDRQRCEERVQYIAVSCRNRLEHIASEASGLVR